MKEEPHPIPRGTCNLEDAGVHTWSPPGGHWGVSSFCPCRSSSSLGVNVLGEGGSALPHSALASWHSPDRTSWGGGEGGGLQAPPGRGAEGLTLQAGCVSPLLLLSRGQPGLSTVKPILGDFH